MAKFWNELFVHAQKLQRVCIWTKNASKSIPPVVLELWKNLIQGGVGGYIAPSPSYTLDGLREHCLAEK